MRKTFAISTFVFMLAVQLASINAQTLRIGSWNVANGPNNGDAGDFSLVVDALGRDVRPSIFAIQETDTGSSIGIRDVFNSTFGVNTFEVTTSSSDGGNDRTGFVYDTSAVNLLNEFEISSGLTHNTLRSTFQLLAFPAADPITIYSVHLKSGASTSDVSTRISEAAVIQADADLLGSGDVLFAGDFNAFSSSALTNLDAVDVAGAPGEWRDNLDFLSLHTQDPGSAVNDRFDLHLASDGLLDGSGLDYLDGSFTVLGNNGTHTLNGSIDTGTGETPEVLAALMASSDHLPIYSDYVFVAVPEPSSAAIGLFLAGYLLARRRR